MARRKQTPSTETRAVLIQTAYELFLKHGYHATSMRDIAARAKLSVAAAYNHFTNKDRLFVAVLREHHFFHQILSSLAEVEGDSVEDFLRQGARRIQKVLSREPGFLRLMLIEIVEFDGRHNPEVFSDFIPRLAEFTRSVTRRRGGLRPFSQPVLIRSFAGLFVSYYISEILIWQYLPKSMRKNCLDDFIEIYLHGVLASPGAK